MSAISYCDGAYSCTMCSQAVQVPPGAIVRHGFATVTDGERDRVLYVNGEDIHRCRDNETTGLGVASASKRRR